MNVLLAAEYYFANPDFVRISVELAKRKHNVNVATSLRIADKKQAERRVQLIEINPFATIYSIPHTLSFPVMQLSRIIKEQDIDIVHALNDHSTNVASAAISAKVSRRSFAYTLQGITTRIGHPLVDSIVALYDLTIERWVATSANKVILLSNALMPAAVNELKINPEKIVVISSGVDTSHFDPERPDLKAKASQLRDQFNLGDEVVVGYVGRLFPAKGLTYLFSAIKEIQAENPNIALLIVGDGAQRNELETMAKSLKVRTIFAGWQRDVAPFYSLMDIFVLPSLFEGLPNVVLEAMAMRNALVATKVGANPEILSDDENGFLVSPRNFSELATALKSLIEDDGLRAKMGIANRRKVVESFQWSQTVDRIEKVYSEIA